MRSPFRTASLVLLTLACAAHAESPFVLAAFKDSGKTPGKSASPVEASSVPWAKVELKKVELRPLEVEAPIWSDRDVRITKFPEAYKGFQFTQHPAHGLTLAFKVLADGVVVLGCSSRWGTTAEPDVAKGFTTAQKLLDQGWQRHPREEVETSSYDMQFLLFTRACKAGEEFSLRTDKYAPPILLVK